MNPRIETLHEKKLVGKRMTMSLVNNLTGALWGGFMPRRKEITNAVSSNLISMNVYSSTHFVDFKPTNEFDKWAAVEVSDFDAVPTDMETFVLKGGLYAVFEYKGLNTDPSIFQYIYGQWLPASEYVLADRPHFEVLGEKYKNNDPNSEEEIWIPVENKNGNENENENKNKEQGVIGNKGLLRTREQGILGTRGRGTKYKGVFGNKGTFRFPISKFLSRAMLTFYHWATM